MVQEQLLSHIAADHQEEPGEVVALVSNPLQPDQVGTCSLYWTQYTMFVAIFGENASPTITFSLHCTIESPAFQLFILLSLDSFNSIVNISVDC